MPKSSVTPEQAFALMEKAEIAVENGADPETLTRESLTAEDQPAPDKTVNAESVKTEQKPGAVVTPEKVEPPKVDELADIKQKYSSLQGTVDKKLKPIQAMENRYGVPIETFEPILDLVNTDPKFRDYVLKYQTGEANIQPAQTMQQTAEEENVDWDDPVQRQKWLDKKLDEHNEKAEKRNKEQTQKQREAAVLTGFQSGLKSSTESALSLAGGDQTKVDEAMKTFWKDFQKGDLAKYAVSTVTMDARIAAAREEGRQEGINSIKTKLPNSQTVPRTAGADGMADKSTNKSLAEMENPEDIVTFMRTLKPFTDEWFDAEEKAKRLEKHR